MLDEILSLTDYCKKYKWPTKRQWRNIIHKKLPPTVSIVKIGKKYFVNVEKLKEFTKIFDKG